MQTTPPMRVYRGIIGLSLLALALSAQPRAAHAQRSGARSAAKVRVSKTRKVPVSKKRAVVLLGMPGSGKTFVSHKLAAKLRISKPLVSGDVIREAAGKAKTKKEQGERVLAVARKFAALQGEVGRRMALKAHRTKGDTVVVEGFRTPGDLKEFRKAFPNTTVVALDVPDALRHQRQLARGRAGEDNIPYLKKRDAQERRQGLGELMKKADLKVRVTSNDPVELDRVLSQIAGSSGLSTRPTR